MLSGKWNNFDELEEMLNLDELMSIVNAQQEQEYRRNKFMASLQGLSLDGEDTKDVMSNIAELMAKAEEEQGLTPVETREEKRVLRDGNWHRKGGKLKIIHG